MIQMRTNNITFGSRLISPTTARDLTQYSAFYAMPHKITDGFKIVNENLPFVEKKDVFIPVMARTPGAKNFDTIILTHLKEGQTSISPFEDNVVRISVAELNKMKNATEVAWNLMGHCFKLASRP
jgi:hypothetical protein